MRSPELILRTPWVVPGNASVFTFAMLGSLDGMKSLFSKGLTSPYYVCISNGRTALHVSNTQLKLSAQLMTVLTINAAVRS